MPTPAALPEIVGINLPRTVIQAEIIHDVNATPELLTDFSNPVSQDH
jgi:hypothetical protein